MSDRGIVTVLTTVVGVGAWFLGRRAAERARFFDGKVVLISGGSRGLGLILAREFARAGAIPIICARNIKELEAAHGKLEAEKLRVYSHGCDVSDREQLRQWVHSVVECFGTIDILVNNAGIIQVGPWESMGEPDYRQAMETNFFGCLYPTLEALPFMRRKGLGRIVNITSIGAQVPVPHLLPYTASKFAMLGFSEALGVELRRSGIKVVTVIPGLMRTGSFLNALFKGQRTAEFTWFSMGASLPFVSMDAERAARAVMRACRKGIPVVTLGLPAKLLRLAFVLAPAMGSRFLSLANRLILPTGANVVSASEVAKPDKLHRSRLSSPPFTALGDGAARKFNEAS